MLGNQQFSTIVLRAQFYPPPILEVIGQRYETTDLIQMNGRKVESIDRLAVVVQANH